MILIKHRTTKRKPPRGKTGKGKMLLDVNAGEPGVPLSADAVVKKVGKDKVWVA